MNEEAGEKPSFKVTPRAIESIQKYLRQHLAEPGWVLRIGVAGGGCSGLSYRLDIGHPMPNDHVFENVAIDPKSMVFLNGSVLEWNDGLMESGFKIINPRVKSTCGCGESFQYE